MTAYDQYPELPGYMSVAQAAKLFGVTKQAIYYQIEARKYTVVYRVGGAEQGERPFLLLLKDEVLRVHRREKEQAEWQAANKPLPVRLNAWHRRVKDWGIQTSWGDREIKPRGVPPTPLIDAYLQVHPDDPKPV